ncbi:hypothetical protein CR513_11715, partial [Mucuna pruriens]
SISNILYELDPKIDRTLHRLRKVRSSVVSNSSSSNFVSNFDNSISATIDSDFSECSSSNINFDCNFGLSNFQELNPMENNDRTLKELAMQDVPVLLNTWRDMKCMFLEKFFPASRIATIKKEICGIRKHSEETLYEYWERFNKVCTTCPHHQISE